MENIKIISLNIESSKHFDTVMPFLKSEDADVVCLQEVFEKDVDLLRSEFDGGYYFSTMTKKIYSEEVGYDNEGILIISKHKSKLLNKDYYVVGDGGEKKVPMFDFGGMESSVAKVLMVIEIDCEGKKYIVGTTHFTWTNNGEADDVQRRDWQSLSKLLKKYKEIVFCGDFNMPRGREMWGEVSKCYKDNIPKGIESSLDSELHRVPELRYVVDGMFSSEGYNLSNVAVKCGVSDHCAIVGYISTH